MRQQFLPYHEGHVPALTHAHPARQATRAGRFAETPRVPVVRRVYRLLCRVAPALAARLAYRQLATPPRAALRPWPIEVRAQTRRFRLSSGVDQVEVYEWGHGRPILLVHGWGSNASQMGRMVLPLVLGGFRVLAFDAPAHGRSSGERTDLVEFASAVATVARYAGPLHAVVGHSFGAAMALYAARDWGLDTSRLVLISAFNHCNWFVELFAQHVGLSPEVHERVQAMFVLRYSGRFDWARMSVIEMARHSHLPVMLVHDESDVEVPFEHGLAISAALQRPQFLVTRGLGHQRVVRNPDVIRRVVAFVSHAVPI